MTEIEKMYENAGIKKCNHSRLLPCPFENKCEEGCEYHWYPDFDAEKQLEFVKFLFNHSVLYDVDSKGNYWFHISDDCYTYYYNKFEVALANIINEMWQDLTDQEKEEIRNILNENS